MCRNIRQTGGVVHHQSPAARRHQCAGVVVHRAVGDSQVIDSRHTPVDTGDAYPITAPALVEIDIDAARREVEPVLTRSVSFHVMNVRPGVHAGTEVNFHLQRLAGDRRDRHQFHVAD